MKAQRSKGLRIKKSPPYFPTTFLGFCASEDETKERRAELEKKFYVEWHKAEARRQERELSKLVVDLGQTISELNQSFLPPYWNWPADKVLHDFTRQVEEVCRYLGRQDTRFFWENCAFVEDRKSKLRLQKCISNLVDRAVAIDERPLRKFLEAASRKDRISGIAKELISILPKLTGRALEITTIDWMKFQPLFSAPGSSIVQTNFGDAAASQRFQCYTKCLEILLDDLNWRRRHSEGSMRMLSWVAHSFPKMHPIFEKMQRFAVFPGSPEHVLPSTIDYMLAHKTDMKRAQARSRKRAERSRKIGKTA